MYGASKDNADNGEWESAAGRAYMHKLISRRQYDAAQAYERVIIRYAVANNIPAPFPRSPEFDADLRGRSHNDLEPDNVASINADYQNAFAALQDAGRQASLQVHALVKDGLNCYTLQIVLLDNLRRGLDALADHFKIPRNIKESLDAA